MIYFIKNKQEEHMDTAIIGGADGPTAIFISSPINMIFGIVVITLILGGIIVLCLQKNRK